MYGRVAVWVRVWWWDERCNRLKKKSVIFFRLSFPIGGSSRISRVVRLDPPVEILSPTKLSRGKALFRWWERARFGLQSIKAVFD